MHWIGPRTAVLIRRLMHRNRLADEKSPYLLQHANNPVNWQPWDEEAFKEARTLGRPIFLSVGYSTCHWCHVMERESFEDDQVAQLLNEAFVSIKVDREERPDVDAHFMTFVQATTGGGGWPMSVFLTPDRMPFFGGTYFDKEGFKNILRLIASKWTSDRSQLEASGAKIISALAQIQKVAPTKGEGTSWTKERAQKWIDATLDYYKKRYDGEYGGFEGAPKFPTPVNMQFLLDVHRWRGDGEALKMVDGTLKAIWRGGIHDHIGGGIHRYAVDRRWLLPHFEKMLYDQAQLLSVYSQTFKLTGSKDYLQAVKEIGGYMRDNLRHPQGGFYCAEDADSMGASGQKEEGAFAVWTAEEIKTILSDVEAALVISHYGVQDKGNVPSKYDHHGELEGKNVLMEQRSVNETAKQFDLSEEECARRLLMAKEHLLEVRKSRPRPHLDDKIILSWNALAISGLCVAFQSTHDTRLLQMATQCVQFIKGNMFDVDKKVLYRSFRQGPGNIPALAVDFIFLIRALLDLWKCTLEGHYLEWARSLQHTLDDDFWDEENGGYFTTRADDRELPLRLKDSQDGAEPAPTSVAAMNLLHLGLMDSADASKQYEEKYRRLVAGMASDLDSTPFARPALLSALIFEQAEPTIATFVLPKDGDLQSLDRLREAADSRLHFSLYDLQTDSSRQKPAVVLCRGTQCQAPIEDPDQIVAP